MRSQTSSYPAGARTVALLLLILISAGCTAGTPIRYLSSDACLILPEKTTRAEVISFLGEPDQRSSLKSGETTWLYRNINRSFLKKLPLIGKYLGSENHETVTVTFSGDLVRTCLYRQFDEDELTGEGAEIR